MDNQKSTRKHLLFRNRGIMTKDRCSNYNKLVKLENNVCSRGGALVKLLGRYVHILVFDKLGFWN